MAQPENEPQEGISTSPSTLRPTWVLCTHQQHIADYVHLMVEAGMSLPIGKDQSVPLVNEVFLFFGSLLTLVFIPLLILYLNLLIAVSSFPPGVPENTSG